jgi:pimeloyl-ACP methyl ester carboxylesterase
LATQTAVAAALIAAVRLKPAIGAIVCHGGRPDFAGEAVREVAAPTLLIAGERDEGTVAVNRAAFDQLTCTKELTIVAGAGHLLAEPPALDRLATLAGSWFHRHLNPRASP